MVTGHQLCLALRWSIVGDERLATIADAVLDAWNSAADTGAMSQQTVTKFSLLVNRFCRFATAHGIESINDITTTVVEDFVHARGRDRSGERVEPSLATKHIRLSTLRVFFRTARSLGIGCDDPTAVIDLPGRGRPGHRRALTPDEAQLVRFFADLGAHKRHSSTVALLLAGARTGEIGHLTVGDIDANKKAARLPGSVKYAQRVVPLDDHAAMVLKARIAHLGGDPRQPLCDTGTGSDAARQARVGMTVGAVLRAAGLSVDPAITPTSLTAYAGAQAFGQTGLIEDAARVMGARSLDSAATLIGFDWQDPSL